MKKRKELNALIGLGSERGSGGSGGGGGGSGRKKRHSRKGSASGHRLLRTESAESSSSSSSDPDYGDGFGLPGSRSRFSKSDYLRCCKLCYPLCAFVILAACVVACVGLVWMQVALKEDLDVLKEKFRTMESNQKTSFQEIPRLTEDLLSKQKELDQIKSGDMGLNKIWVNITEINKQISLLMLAVNHLKANIKSASDLINLPVTVEDLQKSVATIGSTVTSVHHDVETMQAAIEVHKKTLETLQNEMSEHMEDVKKKQLSLFTASSVPQTSEKNLTDTCKQCLPILRTNRSFADWNKDLRKFIWQGENPRIKMKNLTEDKGRGGFGMPDLKLYYEASNLIWIKDWIFLKNKKLLNLEGWDLCTGWHSYIWYEKIKKERNFNNHIHRSALIKTWNKYKIRMYNKTPRWLSPTEALQRRLIGRSEWPRYEEIIKKEGQDYILLPQQEIKNKYRKITWLKYWQIKEYFKMDKRQGFMEKGNIWDRILTSEDKTISKISKIYRILNEWNTKTEIVKNNMTKWAKNIGRNILMEEWEACWNRIIKFTYSYNLKENWLKMFYRWHFTPKKLGSINKTNCTKCWKCRDAEGTFHHMWWTCKFARKYWNMLHEYTQKILGNNLPKLLEIFLLNISKIQPGSNDEKILTYLSTAARIVYARYWKQNKSPEFEEWLIKVAEIKTDRLTFLMAKQQGRPRIETDWNKVERFLNLKLKKNM
ncbi:EF-hand calcium-binding domain-containing protein 14 isoform X1 [Anolis carolinensis]|uniref:EF-hand calcium-binding domain-containing protein 14 isoform X1 n=1 Tax=Anolis carolinensis TaxID=28377 RepID=UPI002F2B5EAE